MLRDPLFYFFILPIVTAVSVVVAAFFPNPNISKKWGKAGLISAILCTAIYFIGDQIYFSKSGKHLQDLLDQKIQCRMNPNGLGCLKFQPKERQPLTTETDPTDESVVDEIPIAGRSIEGNNGRQNITTTSLEPSELQWDYIVRVQSLNLRASGYADSQIINVLSRGDKLRHLGVSSNNLFFYVQTESGRRGFVRNLMVEPISIETQTNK